MKNSFRFAFLLLVLLFAVIVCEDLDLGEDDVEEDPLSVGGGTQQTCDACRTVMEQLLEAIEEASHKKEYVPVIPEEEVSALECALRVVQATGV